MSGPEQEPPRDAPRAPGGKTIALFCVGNADERYTSLALENLLLEMASAGMAPLSVFASAPPFGFPPERPGPRDRLGRHFEYYTAARIPALRLNELCQHLSEVRRRSLFVSEGSRFDAVVISGPSLPENGVPAVADAVVLFVTKGTSTAGWVYTAARTLSVWNPRLPVAIVFLNTAHLEEAAIAFHDVREETLSLLQKEMQILFAGYLKFDPDYAEAALKTGRAIIEQFPGSPLHGQVKYVLRSLQKVVPAPPIEPYFSRMASWVSRRSRKTEQR
jgi:hypothetical protein